MCVCPHGLAEPFLQSNQEGPCDSSSCALSSPLREGCVQKIAGISPFFPSGPVIPDSQYLQRGIPAEL